MKSTTHAMWDTCEGPEMEGHRQKMFSTYAVALKGISRGQRKWRLYCRLVCDGLVKEVAYTWRCQDWRGSSTQQRAVRGLRVSRGW